jgi:hypothetical protein
MHFLLLVVGFPTNVSHNWKAIHLPKVPFAERESGGEKLRGKRNE